MDFPDRLDDERRVGLLWDHAPGAGDDSRLMPLGVPDARQDKDGRTTVLDQLRDSVNPVAPAEVPHLASPENLPTGTTLNEGDLPAQSPNVGYLKDLWHAIQTQDITGKDALLALTQRPMSTPEPGSENLNAGPGIAPGPVGDVPPAPLGAEAAPAPLPGEPVLPPAPVG